MMVSLLLYGYCGGIPSSRKIEKATYEQVPFRVLAANQHPHHDTICTFRRHHLKPLLPELTNINNYSKDCHHNGDSSTAKDNELKTYVKRTLDLIHHV